MFGENLTLTSAVSSVVTAFRDADTIVQRLKVRCVAKRILLPDLLEHTVAQAPDEIEKAQQRCVERFGPSFQQGDHIAIISVQQITISMQMELLDSLRRALDEPEAANFTTIIDHADSARDGALAALMSLRQRLISGGSPPDLPSFGVNYGNTPSQYATPPSRHSSIVPPIPQRDQRRQPAKWVDPYFAPKDTQPGGSAPAHHARSGSVFGFLKRQPTKASSQYSNSDVAASERRSETSDAWSYDPIRPAVRSIASSSEDTNSHLENERYHTFSSHWTVNDVTAQSPVSDTSRADSVMSAPPTHPLHVQSIAERLTTPAAENGYLGFCKGAWRVQVDDPKAMTERRDFTQSAQSQVTYPSCTKCAFRGHVNVKIIWNKVYVDELRGLKYRWAFLAKSHVKQKNVLEKDYSYQCLFCVFLGHKSPIYSKGLYLDHLSKDHRHGLFSSVLLYRTNCINNRVCENTENFDINLFPMKYEPLRTKSEGVVEQLTMDANAFELAG